MCVFIFVLVFLCVYVYVCSVFVWGRLCVFCACVHCKYMDVYIQCTFNIYVFVWLFKILLSSLVTSLKQGQQYFRIVNLLKIKPNDPRKYYDKEKIIIGLGNLCKKYKMFISNSRWVIIISPIIFIFSYSAMDRQTDKVSDILNRKWFLGTF